MTFLVWALATGTITLAVRAGIVAYEREQRRRQMPTFEHRVEFAERLLEERSPPGDAGR